MSSVLAPIRQRPIILAAASLLALVAFFLIAVDQGQALALVQGDFAYQQNVLHELVHDARHVAGFPCH